MMNDQIWCVLKQMSDDIATLKTCIIGNGTKGLSERVADVEDKISTLALESSNRKALARHNSWIIGLVSATFATVFNIILDVVRIFQNPQ